MSLIKGKEVLNKTEVKEQTGYLSVNLNPEQWKLVKSKTLKIDEIDSNVDKVYFDRQGNERLDLRLSLNNKSTNIKVIGEENIHEIIELFEEVETVYCKATYEQVYMKGRRLLDLELLDYDSDEDEQATIDMFS